MRYEVFAERSGFGVEWVWSYEDITEAQKRVGELLQAGYDDAWVYPASGAQALDLLEAEVASLRGKIKYRNRQIRNLRRQLRK